MNKATPSVNIPALARTGVTAAEAAPSAAGDFTNFFTQNVDTRGGGPLAASRIKNALLPLWVRYERGRFFFRKTLNSGTLTDATVAVYGRTPEGVVRFLGQKSLNASLEFDPFEFDIEPGMTYAVRVSAISGTTPNIDVAVSAQAYFENR